MSEACSDFELLEADIRRQPALLKEREGYLRQAAEAVQARRQAAGQTNPPRRIYLVACGDGLSAAMAASFTWERLLDCPVEAVPAMTFSRYRVEGATAGGLAIFISQSGQVVRVIEALAEAQKRGLETLVVTNRPDSPLAGMALARQVFELDFNRLGFTPGTSSYSYTLAALYELAAAFGRDERLVGELRQQLDQLPQAMSTAVESVWEPVAEFAGRLEREQIVLTLGSGPAYGTAHYTMRKLYEICQCKAALLETEEYAHDAYYALDRRTATVLFAPRDAGWRRCVEVSSYLTEIGGPLAVVSSTELQKHFDRQGMQFVGLPGSNAVEASMTYAVAGQALACLAGKRLGGAFYACNDPVRYARGDAQIYESERMDLEDGDLDG